VLRFYLGPWHAAAHIASCQRENDIRNAQGMGLAYGDAPEQLWASLRPHGLLMKYFSTAEWYDHLDDAVRHAKSSCEESELMTDGHSSGLS